MMKTFHTISIFVFAIPAAIYVCQKYSQVLCDDKLFLHDKKLTGLFPLLDEESVFQKATDMMFAKKLKEHLNGNACFKGERGGAFRICHFAGENEMIALQKGQEDFDKAKRLSEKEMCEGA